MDRVANAVPSRRERAVRESLAQVHPVASSSCLKTCVASRLSDEQVDILKSVALCLAGHSV